MGFRQFSPNEYERFREQHNIMALVGNGFDIQVTEKYETEHSPRYDAFYEYLTKLPDFDSTNLIVQQMASLRDQGEPYWSDLEGAIASLVQPSANSVDPEAIYDATLDIQEAFSKYLELVAPPDLLAALGKDSSSRKLATRSMKSCTFEKFEFPAATNHYHLFNFLFVNFNYTPLLDDYIYLDPAQWNPHRHSTVDTHFSFYPNPTGHNSGLPQDTRWSGYVRTEVVHPRGQQAVPRSLLFGIDARDGYDRAADPHRKLMKPYWAMNDIEYGDLFPDVDLFIIFGCSLGRTDGWWWRRILKALVRDQTRSELIIYWWTASSARRASRDEILKRFFVGAGADSGAPFWQEVKDRIHVVSYTDEDPPVWLGL